jgi:hypothetical protein
MRCSIRRNWTVTSVWALVVLLMGGMTHQPVKVHADEGPDLEIHEWSVWLAEPQGKQMNGLADYTSAMPGLVETERARRRDAKPLGPAPMSLMTIYGTPPEVVDIDLRIAAGRPIAQWPRSEGKSARLRWLDLKLSKELINPESLAYFPETHWFHQARQLEGLYIQLKKGDRTERFLTYDLELTAPLNVRLDGGPDQFKIVNLGKHALHDLVLIVPGPNGSRIGWVDTIGPATGAAASTPANPAGANPAPVAAVPVQPFNAIRLAAPVVVVPIATAPVAVAMDQSKTPATNPAATPAAGKETTVDVSLEGPLAIDSDEFKQRATGELHRRLTAAGLKEAEIELLLSLYTKHFFERDKIQLVFRLSQAGIDELTPLSVEPETARIKRVALVVARNVDPGMREDVQKLILELGDARYSKREQAEKRLKELGSMAIPSLKEALKGKDLEVVMRAERILLAQKEQLAAE